VKTSQPGAGTGAVVSAESGSAFGAVDVTSLSVVDGRASGSLFQSASATAKPPTKRTAATMATSLTFTEPQL